MQNRKKYIPKISIVMSVYNVSSYIGTTIESVLQQDFTEWEFIIIDDASTDNTSQIVKRYSKKDERFVFIQNKLNLGPAINRNIGINKSRSEIIATLDGDDIWTDFKKLRIQLAFLNDNVNYGLVGCFASAVDIKNKKLFELNYPVEDADIRKILLRHDCFVHSSLMLRKSFLIEVGKYNMEYRYSDDYDLCLKIGTVSKFHNIPEFMVNYRINPTGISSTSYLGQQDEALKIIKKYRNYYPMYILALILWNLRKIYPLWFRGAFSIDIKKHLKLNKIFDIN